MDDGNRAEVELVIKYGARRKPFFDMYRTTTRLDFIKKMHSWLGDEFPQDFTTFCYHEKSRQMIELGDNEMYYLAPIFDRISSESQIIGVQSVSADNSHCLDLFISARNSSISPQSSSEAFIEQFQSHLDRVIDQNLNSTTTAGAVFSNDSPLLTCDDLLKYNLFDKDPFSSSDDPQEVDETPVATQHASPTTNIQLQLADHMRMILDVHPTPKRVTYTSNMGKKGTGKLSYLSGIRGPNDRGKQIRPIISMPPLVLQWLRDDVSLVLIVTCVRETLKNGLRIWWIDKHSKLRTKGGQRNIPGINPLQIPLTFEAIKNGTYRLEVILTRISGQINQDRKGELLHTLDEATVIELHPAEHDPESSRLVFIISSFGVRLMNTIGCSNFIRDPNGRTGSINNETNVAAPAAQF